MSAFPYADTNEAVLDIALRHLQPDDAPDDGALDETERRWQVDDERSAEWALLKIRQARQTARRRNAASVELIGEYQRAIDDLQAVIDANDQRAQHTADHFEALLKDWHRRVLAEDPKAISIKLGAGMLKSRAGRDTVEVDDEEAVAEIASAESLDFGEFVPKVNRTKLLSWIKKTGNVPTGARLVKATDDDRRFEVVT